MNLSIQKERPTQPTLFWSPHTSGKLEFNEGDLKLTRSYLILIVVGHIRDFIDKKFNPSAFAHLVPSNVSPAKLFPVVKLICRVTLRSTLISTRSTPVDSRSEWIPVSLDPSLVLLAELSSASIGSPTTTTIPSN
jgi:hypothetical protein